MSQEDQEFFGVQETDLVLERYVADEYSSAVDFDRFVIRLDEPLIQWFEKSLAVAQQAADTVGRDQYGFSPMHYIGLSFRSFELVQENDDWAEGDAPAEEFLLCNERIDYSTLHVMPEGNFRLIIGLKWVDAAIESEMFSMKDIELAARAVRAKVLKDEIASAIDLGSDADATTVAPRSGSGLSL